MTYFTIRYDVVPGKQGEHDRFVRDSLLTFWKRQPGISVCCVLEDVAVGWPERTIMIGATDLHEIEQALKQPMYRALKEELLNLATNLQSQFVEVREGSLAA
ncbi:MAG: hypothetical protein HYX99_03290 [Chloroflexi bacterium]|nr:hypothetical protein [Chloroflexota bacterium]